MSDFQIHENEALDTCGCCQGIEAQVPQPVFNRPGLNAIRYRVGTHSTFKQTLLAGLTDRKRPALKDLTTRSDFDFSISLIDAWSVVSDVLTFYQERIANESYLRTATERYSILHLARLIGYELRPGVAASAWLAFTVEDTPGAPGRAVIEAGTKVQSLPGPGELPQTFETAATIEARAAWNAMPARHTEPHPIQDGQAWYFEGTATNLKPGDGLLLAPSTGDPFFRLVAEVDPQPDLKRTKVILQPPPSTETRGAAKTSPFEALQYAGQRSAMAQYYMTQGDSIEAGVLYAEAMMLDFTIYGLFTNYRTTPPPSKRVLAFRQRASVFGYNAPLWSDKLPPPYNAASYQNQWVDKAKVNFYSDCVPLDNAYPAIVKDSWVVLKEGANTRLLKVDEVNDSTRQAFALTAKVTCLNLIPTDNQTAGLDSFSVLGTTIYAQSEELRLARLPITSAVTGDKIDLEGLVDGLYSGQNIIVNGELSTASGVQAAEPAVIDHVSFHLPGQNEGDDVGYTTITLETGIKNSFVRSSVRVFGNVSRATHGETKQEILGGGTMGQGFQKFSLRQKPLTYVSAPVPSGAQSTLEIRVDGILWHEVSTLVGRHPAERIFSTQIDNDRHTIVQFGGNQMGANPSPGVENVVARYRVGMGMEGLVKEGALSLLPSRPYGVRSVTNPLPASGAAPAENLEEARRNAPLTILTLDRIISLADYRDFVRAFGGIAKAHARFDAAHRVVVTVAGPNGADVPPESLNDLLKTIHETSDPDIPVRLLSYRKRLFNVAGTLKALPGYLPSMVKSAVEAALRQKFSFEAREFNQGVTDSEVIAAIQKVEGVEFVNLAPITPVNPPEIAGLSVDRDAAELLLLSPNPIQMEVVT